MSRITDARCTVCRAEFTNEQLEGATACPSCGAKSVPMATSQDTQIRINWHELRILTIWADNWAQAKCDTGARRALASIVRELEKQRPEGATALTLGGEIRELQDAGVDVEMRKGGQVVVPSRGKPS